jgi:pentatricopeptide repeat protein
VPARFLNAFLTALGRAPTGREGPALAVALFNRVHREEGGLQVAPLSLRTYNILMDCCCRARRPDLGLAIFGRLLRMGLKANQITANTFLKCLCYAKQTDKAVNTLLHRMSDLGCAPDAFSYSFVLKGLCDNGRSQQALDLLQMLAKQGGACSLNVVVYNTVIHGLCNEGQVSKACNLFHEMVQRQVVPNAVTYSMIIQGLLKEGEVSKAELVIQQMADEGVQPDKVAYYSMIHGYSSSGRRKEASKMFGKMKTCGLQRNTVTSTR